MTNFWDLPKAVRQQIYRLHLVHDEPITSTQHYSVATHRCSGRDPRRFGYTQREMPPILAISKKAEREAAPIYYGENHFEFDTVWQAAVFAMHTYPRHLRMIRKVTCSYSGNLAREGFLALGRMKGLQELYIRVNEGMMIRESLSFRHERQWGHSRYIPDEELTPQQQMGLIRYPGMTALLAISNIPHVEFTNDPKLCDRNTGGPLPGGYLETQVLPKLKGLKNTTIRPIGLDDDRFPFLSLPPEIRNRIYSLLLCIPGRIHPSTQRPSSTRKKNGKQKTATPTPESALSLLAVNKQINDEAFGVFYHCNAFEFYYPTQLHAFLLSIGEERQYCLRDLTVHYFNHKVGGIDLAELTLPLLKQLKSLRRLHVRLNMDVEKFIRSNYVWSIGSGWNLNKANPLRLPGMKILFSLRGVTDIKVRCGDLEKEFEEAKKDKEYPNFSAKSKKACVVRMVEVLEHFNEALAYAQNGKVNKKMLDDPEWHMKDVFPTIEDETVDKA